jgi:mRNA interferase RelE/StbE
LKVEILKKAQNDIEKLDKKELKDILLTIKDLENYPNISNIKKLVNYKPIYRKRIGNYRILFEVIEKMAEIKIYKIGHRKNIYQIK